VRRPFAEEEERDCECRCLWDSPIVLAVAVGDPSGSVVAAVVSSSPHRNDLLITGGSVNDDDSSTMVVTVVVQGSTETFQDFLALFRSSTNKVKA